MKIPSPLSRSTPHLIAAIAEDLATRRLGGGYSTLDALIAPLDRARQLAQFAQQAHWCANAGEHDHPDPEAIFEILSHELTDVRDMLYATFAAPRPAAPPCPDPIESLYFGLSASEKDALNAHSRTAHAGDIEAALADLVRRGLRSMGGANP